ncbi:MAG TPA: prolyl oligopeptidase family serine peptidase [Rhodothermales bacterium]|nr:prolyl oligopeptidase family serine peptidase [Rhodothermales bacterium]
MQAYVLRLMRRLRSLLLICLLPGVAGCVPRLATSTRDALLDRLFAPPTPQERAAVEADWAHRDVRARDVRVEWEGRSGSARLLVLSHRIGAVRHVGAVRVPRTAPGTRLPVLVIGHGGDRGTSPREFIRRGPLAEGWIQVLPTFRSERLYATPLRWYRAGGTPSPWDRDTDDALALLDAVLRHVPGADSTRIAALGRSRGGGVALLMAARDPRIDAVVVQFGPTDFLLPDVRARARQALSTRLARLPGAGFLADSFLFALRDGRVSVAQARVGLLRRSPAWFAHRLPPVQIHHGTVDRKVPPAHGIRLHQALVQQGRPVELHLYDAAGHRARALIGHQARIEAFLIRHVTQER